MEELNVKAVRLLVVLEDDEKPYRRTVRPNKKAIFERFGKLGGAVLKASANVEPDEFVRAVNSPEGTIRVVVRGEVVEVPWDCFNPSQEYKDGWHGAYDGTLTVLIDKRLTPDLKREGIARDLVRNVQNLRKDAGLDIADRITLALVTDADEVRAAVEQFSEYIGQETLALKIQAHSIGEGASSTEAKIAGASVTIELTKGA